MIKDEIYNIFPKMLLEYADDLYYNNIHRGVFIGKYMDKLKPYDLSSVDLIKLKHPQFVSNQKSDHKNNWLDVMLEMNEIEFNYFKKGLDT